MGGEQQLLHLVKGLKEQDIESVIACKDKLHSKAIKMNFKTINLKTLKEYIKLIKVAKSCDIIHAHSSRAHSLGILLKILTHKPLIYTRRVDFKQKRIAKLKYLLTDGVVCVSDAVNNILHKNFSIISDVIYDAIDINLINRVDNEKVKLIRKRYGPVIVGNIGALTNQKDHKTLINAATLMNENITFIVLGEGYLRKEPESYVKQKNLQKNFFFIGFKEDIYNYLASMDVFVISYQHEGLCSSILQAFLFNKPVVATESGGVQELIGKHRGYLVPTKNPKALAEAVETVFG